jgi:hypothetical protein
LILKSKARQIIDRIRHERGMSIQIVGGKLRVGPKSGIDESLAADIRQAAKEIIRCLSEDAVAIDAMSARLADEIRSFANACREERAIGSDGIREAMEKTAEDYIAELKAPSGGDDYCWRSLTKLFALVRENWTKEIERLRFYRGVAEPSR